MRKTILTVSAAALLLTVVAAGPAWSQTQVSLNAGVQTNVWQGTSFDNAWFTLDLRIGIPLGASFELSPEILYAVDDSFDFSIGWLYPGVLLNFKSGGFFAGGGVTLPIVFGEGDSDTASPSPKVNLGYNFGHLKLTAYFQTLLDSGLDFLDLNFAGVTLGYRF